MQKQILKIFLTLAIFLILPSFVSAAPPPVLNFTDITSGPKTGLNDGLGSGAIVTIWGNNLGSAKGNSKVYFQDSNGQSFEAAYVYYWKNADGQMPGGPADLYSYHKMQEIAFSIPFDVADGAGKIFVSVNGISSNQLDFTVRNGNIYHVKTTGNSSNSGTWNNPWLSLKNGALGKIKAGDIVYIGNGVQDIDTHGNAIGYTLTGILFSGIAGTIDEPLSIVVYPNCRALAQGVNYGMDVYQSQGIIVSKYVVKAGDFDMPDSSSTTVLAKAGGSGMKTSALGRLVGNEITQITGKCVSGWSGAIYSGGDYISGAKVYGNYIHDWGCNQTSKFEHTTYMTIRNSGAFDVAAWEMGWNYLLDNKAKYGLHNYDENYTDIENPCGNFIGKLKIHNNAIVNQKGPGINIGAMSPTHVCWNGDFDIYNNILVNTGLGPSDESQAELTAVRIGDSGMSGLARIYNNTIYGYGDSTSGGAYKSAFGFYHTSNSGRITVDITNNLINSTNGFGYITIDDSYTHVSGNNNLWFGANIGNASIFPGLTNNLMADPLFRDPANNDYTLMSSSPALDGGTSTIAPDDFFGQLRQVGRISIGATQYIFSDIDTDPPSAPSGFSLQ